MNFPQRPRLLIVDDSSSARSLLRDLLKDYGLIDEAEDGRGAVELFERAIQENKPYAIVFLDILMPNMDGHEAARRIHRLMDSYELPEERRGKIVMISSLHSPDQLMKAHFEDGALLYLPKPIDTQAFTEALANLGILPNPIDEFGYPA